MEMDQIQMYEILKTKLGEKETKAFIHLIDEKMDAKINARKHELATKEDISLLKEDIASLRLATAKDITLLKEDIASLRLATAKDITLLKDDIASLRIATTKDIASLRDDIASLRLSSKDDIAALRLSSKDDMTKLKDELLRTFFVSSLGQLLAIVACIISLVLVIAKK
jgi:hypothetical protein